MPSVTDVPFSVSNTNTRTVDEFVPNIFGVLSNDAELLTILTRLSKLYNLRSGELLQLAAT